MATQLNRKVTFVLPARLIDEVKQVVAEGGVASASALVREALEARLRELRETHLRQEFEAAARDPLFLADLDASMAAFGRADAETARMIPE